MENKVCPCSNMCRNGDEGCYAREPETCVRFMPLEGTNFTKINGVIETPPDVDYDKFSQYFSNWIESMGWCFCGSFKRYEDEENE